MFKRFFLVLSLLFAVGVTSQAQWQLASVFPADSSQGAGTHGIAVDPDGKVWIQCYYAYGRDTLEVPSYDAATGIPNKVYKAVRVIYVFNPDGTQASFSPVFFNKVGGVVKDTLGGETVYKKILNPVGSDSIMVPSWSINSGRGLTLDENGNIVVGYWDYIFKLDYKTGEGLMDRLVAGIGGVVKPGVDAAGNYYVRSVVGGKPLKMFDKAGVALGNALDVTTGFSRVIDVTKDGLTIYHTAYTNHYVQKLHRADEFSSFLPDTLLRGFDCESVVWDPATADKIWFSSGSYNDLPNRYPTETTNYDVAAWYAFDTKTETLTGEKINWDFYVDKNAAERPRAIGFSPDGNTAYVGTFSAGAVRKYTKVTGPTTVEFKCNMSVQLKKGTFAVGDEVYVEGSFNGWANDKKTVLTDPDGDSVYTKLLTSGVNVGDVVNFKFRNNHGGTDNWEGLDNRVLTVKEGANVFSAYWNTTTQFKCNMGTEIRNGNFSVGDKVWVRGSFNNWGNSGLTDELTDVDGDSVYTGIVTSGIVPGGSIEFKFYHNHGGVDNWENVPNRPLTIKEGTNTFSAYWNVPFIPATAKTIQMAFSVDVEIELVAGFLPPGGAVELRGDLFGWGPGKTMTASATNINIYETTQPVTVSVGDKINYKFWHGDNSWENDNLTDNTQNNRYYIITQTDYDAASATIEKIFNNGSLETVINQPANITFTCNTKDRSITNAPTNTVFDNVVMAGANLPLKWPDGGWTNVGDTAKVIFMYDDGTNGDAVSGDKIFTKVLTFPKYSSLTIDYKYGANFGLSTNGGSNDNEAGVSANHYLKLAKTTESATVADTFGISWTKDLTKVEKLGNTLPSTYLLEQNYPNPFNPETSIRFSIPQESFVTVKVFNTLGEEVATLLNEVKTAGTYNVSFNAKNLTSGIYFYTIKANDFSSTKKMILLR